MKNFSRLFIALFLVMASIGTSWAIVAQFPIVSSTDDHEEYVKDGVGYSHGGTNSIDLDLGRDGDNRILVGLRFQNVTIPKGSTINSAVIEFVAGSTAETYTRPQNASIKLDIKGQKIAKSPDPLTFATNNSNIYSRWNNFTTAAGVTWQVGSSSPWSDNQKYQTNEIKTIVQEIIDLNDWTSGNAMVIMLRRNDTDNKRMVYSYDGSPVDVVTSNRNYAPKLIIDYTAPSGGGSSTTCIVDVRVASNSDDADDRQNAELYRDALRFGKEWVGLRFASVNVPKGANITGAVLKLATGDTNVVSNDKDESKVTIWGQKSTNPSSFTTTEDDIKDRPKTSKNVDWSENTRWTTYKEAHTSPDISGIVQEIVGQNAWSAANPMVFLLEDDKGQRPILAHDDEPNFAPLLHIEYTCGSGGTVDPVLQPTIAIDVASSTEIYLGTSVLQGQTASPDTMTITNSGAATLNYTITGLPDWLSLSKLSGTLAPSASDAIAVTYSSASLAEGTYQATLTITDPNATNPDQTVPVSLTIYTLPVSNSSCSNIPLYVQNRVSPAVLVNLDLSGSMRTMMPVSPAGGLPRTPDLKSIIQEIVNTGNSWVSGNDIAFIVTGSGSRRAWSYDGKSNSAPRLFVTFTDASGTSQTISSRIADRRDDAEQRTDNTNFSDSRSELNFGSRVIGMRFQRLDIPDGATITEAYIEFSISSPDSAATSLTFYGHKTNDASRFANTITEDVTRRTKTSASVSWSNVPEWKGATEQSRLTIAQNVIGEIFKNRNINWGFGTWTGDYASSIDYTKIEVGCKQNTDAQQSALQAAVLATQQGGYTPFVPSMQAAGKYFAGTKTDMGGATFTNLTCQDKFLIEMTDGLGNIPSTTNATAAASQTAALAAAGISTVAVGFGIDDATMINAVAIEANAKGLVSATDGVYALHDTDPTNTDPATNAVPFLAMNQDELLASLLNISHKIENRFTGSAPAPTTSADDQDLLIVLIAEFGSASWTGNLRAMGFSLLTNDWTEQLWKASDKMPARNDRNVWTVNSSNVKERYTDSTLANDNWLCKDIGDIINSAPVIVKRPNSFYSINNYSSFYTSQRNRNNMVYVGANDGQLHAFLLTGISGIDAGTEMWSFVPKSLLPKLNEARVNRASDMCDTAYCHMYFVDGSPQAADIYEKSGSTSTSASEVNGVWHTILITGLREGGDSYFALDVTDGKPMSNDGTGAKYLWEFTNANLGQTWGDPVIRRVVDTTAGRAWGAFFGSGYAKAGATSSDQSSKEAYIFGIDAYNAEPLWGPSGAKTSSVKLSSTSLPNDATSELLMIDKDYDEDFTTDFIYAGNLYGDIYRIKNIGKGESPVVSHFYESNNTTTAQPIRGRPSFAYSKTAGNYWIYFGTGRYELMSDKTSTTQQYFFGLKEEPDTDGAYTRTYTKPTNLEGVGKITINKLATNRLPNPEVSGTPPIVVLDAKSFIQTYTYTDPATGTNITVSKMVKAILGKNDINLATNEHDSWVIRLGTDSSYSERVVNQPLVVAGVVFFTSFVPDSDPCGGSGGSYLYAVDFKTGLAPVAPVFDVNGDGKTDHNDAVQVDLDGDGVMESVNVAAVYVGKGQASQPVIVGDKIFITTTAPGDEADEEPTKPIGVTLKGLNAGLDSWLDMSFQ